MGYRTMTLAPGNRIEWVEHGRHTDAIKAGRQALELSTGTDVVAFVVEDPDVVIAKSIDGRIFEVYQS